MDDISDIHQELEQLKRDINYHRYRYHVLDSPVVSDAEYDRLVPASAGN